MVSRAVFLCVSALLIQSIAGRCYNPPRNCGCSNPPPPPCGCSGGSISVSNVDYSCGSDVVSVSAPSVVVGSARPVASAAYNRAPIAVSGPAIASSGGSFITTSIGGIAPSGIRVDNTNELYGELLVSGELPYLTAVAFEGQFENNGVASVAYGCGNGDIAITEVIGGAASGANYGGAVLPAANYNSAILPAPSCRQIQPRSCGC